MRLAFTLFKYFPFGGLQRDCLEIAQTCRRQGHDVTLFTREWTGPLPNDLHVHLVPTHGLTNHGRNTSFVKYVLPALKREAFDAVIGFNKMPGLDLYFAGDSCYAERSRRRHGSRWNSIRISGAVGLQGRHISGIPDIGKNTGLSGRALAGVAESG